MAEWTVLLHDKVIKTFPLADGQKVTIGRGKEADVIIDNTAISRQHVSIESTADIFLVSDLGSKNGTFVNGRKIRANEPVSEKDVIEFGKFRLAPATGDQAVKSSDSMVSDMMDLEEETIFVTAKGGGPGKKQMPPRSGKARLMLIKGSATPKELTLEGKSSVKIGKDISCDLQVSGFLVGKPQCYIIKKEDNFFLLPQKSWAATFVNDTKVTAEHLLRKGDIIKIRGTTLRFDL